MTLLLALGLYAVLLYRIGIFDSIEKQRERLAFETQLLAMGEEAQWEDEMKQARQRRPEIHNLPKLCFR